MENKKINDEELDQVSGGIIGLKHIDTGALSKLKEKVLGNSSGNTASVDSKQDDKQHVPQADVFKC